MTSSELQNEIAKSMFGGFLDALIVMLPYFAVLIVILILIRLFKSRIKGSMGETAVSRILSSLPRDEYKVIPNLMLKSGKGTTQIDHVVVSLYGIFVIEVKNYKGLITGGEYDSQWTQTLYKTKNNLRNPIHQNEGHVRALKALINDHSIPYYPIVAFSGGSTLRLNLQSAVVVYWGDLNRTIREMSQETVMDKCRMKKISTLITDSNIDDRKIRKEHVKEIQRKKDAIKTGVCPKCGGQLVERVGKYGKFIGCSNFPKCRYTISI